MINNADFGCHITAVLQEDPSKMIYWAKSMCALAWFYLTSVALPKVSILCLYLHMLTHRCARIACSINIIVLAANWVACIFASTFECISGGISME